MRFYGHSLFGRPSGGRNLFILRFYGHCIFSRRPSGGRVFCFSFLPAAVIDRRPPVAPSFVARRKIGEKDKPRGLRPPLDPRGNVLEEAGRAVCLPSRNGACDAIKSRMACSALLPCALRAAVELMALSQPPDCRPQIRPVILSVPTNSPQLEQYNRVRGNSVLAHATDGPKSR